jgi:hypothetical protein
MQKTEGVMKEENAHKCDLDARLSVIIWDLKDRADAHICENW